MKKIVIDTRESGTTTGRYMDKLAEYLHKLEPEHEVVILTKTSRVSFMKKIAPSFKVVESNFKEFTFSEQLSFLRQIKGLKPDLVHFGMTHQPIFYLGKTVTTIHDLTTARFRNPAKNRFIYKGKQIVYKIVINIVARKSKKLFVPTNFVKRDVAQYTHIRKDKLIVTYEAADKIEAPAEPIKGLKPNSFIMYTGRPLPHKNLDRLVEAFKMLKTAHPALQLALVGKDHPLFTKLSHKVEKEQIKDVIFTGYVSETQLRWLYENTSAYIFPSLSEGFGLPGLEAMAHGAPVVSSHSTSLPEVYGNAAHYFDPYDISDIATRINEVLTIYILRERLIKAGAAQAQKYSWAKMATQTLDVYTDVLNR